MWPYYNSYTSESSRAISHDTTTFTHVLRVLHFNAFLSHNLPYAPALTPSTVQKTINSHSTLHSSGYSCHASVTTIQHSYSLQYSLITSSYKQLLSCMFCETTPRVFHLGALVITTCNSVVNMRVMGLVLGQSFMVISTTGILL